MCKIVHVCGSFPPEPCGIGHYLKNLLDRLADDVDVGVATPRPYQGDNKFPVLKYPMDIFRLYMDKKPNVIHWQLVSQGFRYSLMFLFFFMVFRFCFRGVKIITTMHDFATLKRLNRFRLLIPLRFSHIVTVTTEEQARSVKKYCKELRIIPIGSNVSFKNKKKHVNIKKNEELKILFWGFPAPTRKLTTIFHALSELKGRVRFSFTLMPGLMNISSKAKNEYKKLINELGLKEWIIETGLLPEEEMGKRLLDFDLAYLFYDDGASTRRTTFIGVGGLNIPFITNIGPHTPVWLKRELKVSYASRVTAEAIVKKTLAFYENSYPFFQEARRISSIVEERFSWEGICDKHNRLYGNVI